MTKFTIFGNKYRMGSYIILIRVKAPALLAFGKFRKGELLTIPEGSYLYIGSALGSRQNSSPLSGRVLRHATRSGGGTPHKIREALLRLLKSEGMARETTAAPSSKKVRWHIDYLLDLPQAEISHILLIRSPIRLEGQLSALLESSDGTSLLAPRLGAQDSKNSTHILKISEERSIIRLLGLKIPEMMAE
ncbi:MAG: DUF123 domain-containing protein [Chlorobiaceae bacterium]